MSAQVMSTNDPQETCHMLTRGDYTPLGDSSVDEDDDDDGGGGGGSEIINHEYLSWTTPLHTHTHTHT